MEIHRATLATCAAAVGTVVVIDVLRAFTTAAYAFAAGARQILVVRTVEEALSLRQRFPGAWVMGEVKGLPPPGFDLGNSPTRLQGLDLHDRTLIQRTSSGTQAIVLSQGAQTLLAASFVCATATARYILSGPTQDVTFVISGADLGQRFDGRPIHHGDEDAACADYIEALLRGEAPNPGPYLQRVLQSPSAIKLADPRQVNLPPADLDCSIALDRFNFALCVNRQGDLLVMEKLDA